MFICCNSFMKLVIYRLSLTSIFIYLGIRTDCGILFQAVAVILKKAIVYNRIVRFAFIIILQ